MRDSILPPYVWLVFIVIAILAGLVGVIIDHREMLAARLEIVQSHRTMASIVAYRVERADYTAHGAPATVRVKRDRYLLTLEFTDMDGVLQQADLQWFNVYEMGGLPVRRHPPWVGELEELERQPLVRIYQHNSSPARVRLAHPLDELAGGSEIDP